MSAPRAALVQALRRDPDLVYLGTGQPDALVEEFGTNRIRGLPVARNAMLDYAIGLATAGLRPVVDVGRAADLLTAVDALANRATRLPYPVPLTVLAVGTRQEPVPYAMLAQVPGLVVAVPATGPAADGLLATAMTHPDPVVIVESPALLADEPEWTDGDEVPPVPFGRVHVVRHGDDVTIVAIGMAVRHATEAAGRLAETGIGATVVDVRTVAPLDVAGIAEAAAATGRVLVVDEAPAPCSAASEIVARLLVTEAVRPADLRQLNASRSLDVERHAVALLTGSA